MTRRKKYKKEKDRLIPYFHEFLHNFKRSSRTKFRNKVHDFRKFLHAEFKKDDILTAEYEEFVAFFDKVNDRIFRGKPIQYQSKEFYRTVLNRYFSFIKKLKATKGETFQNPVPGRDIYRFDKPVLSLSDVLEKQDKKQFTYNIALKLLNHFYYNNFRDFIMTGIFAWTGARRAEVINIKTQNILLEERPYPHLRLFLIRLKTTHGPDRYATYFFPHFFIQYLKLLIEQNKLIYPKSAYLFPTRYKSDTPHITEDTINKHLAKAQKLLGIKTSCSPHKFRKLLNTHRIRKGIKSETRKLLLNHKIKSTEFNHYNLDTNQFKKIQDLYDKTFPYPEFVPNPHYLQDYQ